MLKQHPLLPLIEAGRGKILSPFVANSTRAALLKLVEHDQPSDGIYYALRYPTGWQLFAYRYDDFPSTLDHTEVWEDFCAPVMANHWAPVLKHSASKLEVMFKALVYAFPRGRVINRANPGNREKGLVVYHGDDLPSSISRNTVQRMFSLPPGTQWELDDHERCQKYDRDVMRRLLKLKPAEIWPAADIHLAWGS